MTGFFGTPTLDDFNRADGGLGANWSTLAGTLSIASNQLAGGTAGNNVAVWTPASPGPDCEVWCEVSVKPNSGQFMTLALRTIDLGGGILNADGYDLVYTVQAGTDTFAIRRFTNATPTQLGATINQELNAGDFFGLSAVGNELIAWLLSGGTLTELGRRTDSTYLTAGQLIVGISNTVGRINTFGGGTRISPRDRVGGFRGIERGMRAA